MSSLRPQICCRARRWPAHLRVHGGRGEGVGLEEHTRSSRIGVAPEERGVRRIHGVPSVVLVDGHSIHSTADLPAVRCSRASHVTQSGPVDVVVGVATTPALGRARRSCRTTARAMVHIGTGCHVRTDMPQARVYTSSNDGTWDDATATSYDPVYIPRAVNTLSFPRPQWHKRASNTIAMIGAILAVFRLPRWRTVSRRTGSRHRAPDRAVAVPS